MPGDAVFSPCQAYRYRLSRRWGDGTQALFIMLNPSTADASEDDPTIRRCIDFAKREGQGGLVVVNLFAWRATNPKELYKVAAPIGPDNDQHIKEAVQICPVIIAAWGNHGALRGRATMVRLNLLPERTRCFGFTDSGHPVHPLYQKKDAPLLPMATY